MGKSDELMFEYESLLDLISHHIAQLDDSFFIIDGFDECTTTTQHSVLEFLSSLEQICVRGRIKRVISARDSVTELVMGSLPSVTRVIVGSEATNRDMTLFARAILREKQAKGDWCVGEPGLIDEILHFISLGGEGMYVLLSCRRSASKANDPGFYGFTSPLRISLHGELTKIFDKAY